MLDMSSVTGASAVDHTPNAARRRARLGGRPSSTGRAQRPGRRRTATGRPLGGSPIVALITVSSSSQAVAIAGRGDTGFPHRPPSGPSQSVGRRLGVGGLLSTRAVPPRRSSRCSSPCRCGVGITLFVARFRPPLTERPQRGWSTSLRRMPSNVYGLWAAFMFSRPHHPRSSQRSSSPFSARSRSSERGPAGWTAPAPSSSSGWCWRS